MLAKLPTLAVLAVPLLAVAYLFIRPYLRLLQTRRENDRRHAKLKRLFEENEIGELPTKPYPNGYRIDELPPKLTGYRGSTR